jgi:hypothetical protein
VSSVADNYDHYEQAGADSRRITKGQLRKRRARCQTAHSAPPELKSRLTPYPPPICACCGFEMQTVVRATGSFAMHECVR